MTTTDGFVLVHLQKSIFMCRRRSSSLTKTFNMVYTPDLSEYQITSRRPIAISLFVYRISDTLIMSVYAIIHTSTFSITYQHLIEFWHVCIYDDLVGLPPAIWFASRFQYVIGWLAFDEMFHMKFIVLRLYRLNGDTHMCAPPYACWWRYVAID